jgi:DNA (cytosine-5)-methyltransferase 1
MKPAYKVPSMTEIAAIPWNGYKVASTFSGCGGSCLGYRMAGYRVVYANEFIPEAQATYKANHPNSFLDPRDIRTIQPAEIFEASGIATGELDLLDGSPPCSAFSTAGKREGGWGEVKKYSDTEQRVDDLFFEYVRLLKGLQPKVFVAENVTGLIKGTAKGYFKVILAAMKEAGYNVTCRVLDSRWLGVPQARQRTIFIGTRKDLSVLPVHPQPLPYCYTIGEALENVPTPSLFRPLTAGTRLHDYWEASKPGDQFNKISKKRRGVDAFYSHIKMSPARQANTITQVCAMYHWDEPRSLTIAELKRVSGFPDDFILTGSFSKQWERIGRAVPPVMMSHVAATIESKILDLI